MKIVMFTNTYLPLVSGVARSVETFSDDLRTLGHEVHVVCPTFQGATQSTDTILRVPAIQNFNGSDFSVRIPLPGAISRHLHKFRPGLIHAHHPFLLGDAALRTARELGRPLVFTHHTMYEDYTHYVPVNQQLLRQFVFASVPTMPTCATMSLPRVKALPICSGSAGSNRRSRSYRPAWIRPSFPAAMVGRCASSWAFRHQQGDRPSWASGAREESRLFGRSHRPLPGSRAGAGSCCLIVGSGPSQEQIEKTFRDRGFAERLYMAGKRSGQELADAYAAMDLFAFASKTETQGMVLAEAMAAGKPVIALDAPGTREVIHSTEVGRLLDGDADVETFADALAEFPLKDDAYDRHAEAARARARLFSREQCSRRLAEVYKQLDQQSRRESATNSTAPGIHSWFACRPNRSCWPPKLMPWLPQPKDSHSFIWTTCSMA
jgi:1,2-diacylglycerol 3-alpha-glucosyltransferase